MTTEDGKRAEYNTDWWDKFSDWGKSLIFRSPDFDCEKFEEETGIDAREDYQRIMGVEYE